MQTLSSFTFGAEFEVILPRDVSHSIAVSRIAELTGLPVVIGSRTAATRQDCPDWRVVHDGSVGGNGIAAEFVSPILKGENGFEQVAKFANALVTIGATVNSTCGFHVHVGGFRPEISFFKTLVKLYARYETAIDQIMPASRRENRATYCRSLARVNSAMDIDSATTIDQIIRSATGDVGYSSRYYKVNLQSYRKHKTVEFRQHAGTTDGRKAVNWIKTCIRMVIAAQAGKTGTARNTAPTSFASLEVKARKVAEFVTRPEGATREEIIAGTDWSALSVNRQARLAGLEIRVVRERGRDRFFAVVGEQTLVAADLAGLAALIESADEEIAFLNDRAAVFARG